MATTAPVKVDSGTDRLISHAAHFLARSKKDIVDEAVREYVENHREQIEAGVRNALKDLDGTPASSVALPTGVSRDELESLGGFPQQ